MIGVCTRAPGTPHSKLCTTQHPTHTMRSCLCSPSSTAHFTPRQHLAAAVVPRHPNRTSHACAHQQAGRGSHPQQFWLSATPPSADSQPVKGTPEGEEFEGLLPDEDYEVPGTLFDAYQAQTKLGKAVKAAVEELEHLGGLEAEVLGECDDLLKKLGVKGSLFGSGSDNPLLKLQQELQQLEEQEQQELKKQQDQQQQ